MPVLFAFRDDRFGFQFEIGERAVLGRSPECELILFDRATSRFHAEIFKADGRYFLKDLDSTNGTLHNETPVKGQVPLKKNDEIRVGQEIFLFDPDLNVAVGREGAVLIAGEVDEKPDGLVTVSAEPDLTALDRAGLASLYRVAAALAHRPQVSRVIKQSAYALSKLFGATRIALLWPEAIQNERLSTLMLRPEEQRLVLPRPLARLVLDEDQAVLWPSVIAELSFIKGNRALKSETRPCLAAPLKAPGQLRGLLYLDSRNRAYTQKDLNFLTALAGLIGSAVENAYALEQLNHRLSREEAEISTGSDFIGDDPRIKMLLATAGQVAQGGARILLTGEVGTGKEVLAKRIHALSPRKRGPFVSINCAALSPSQIESQLFGQEAGSLTEEGLIGLLEEADGGTFFLQNVDHLPLSVQVDLLRVIEEGVIYRVGSTRPRPVNFRAVSSTNIDLGPAVQNGEFREDLFHRLSEVTLAVPPLREIRDDIVVLAKYFLAASARARGLKAPELDPAAAECLRAYPWPGNVGELKNVMERMVMFAPGDRIVLDDLPLEIRFAAEAFRTAEGERLPDSLIEAEKSLIRRALARSGGDEEEAAQILGLSQSYLQQKIRQYEIYPAQDQEMVITGTDN